MPVDLVDEADYVSLRDGTVVAHATPPTVPLSNPATCTGKYGQTGWTYGMLGKTYGGCDFIAPATFVSGAEFTTEDLLNLTGGVNQRIDSFRFEVLDRAYNVIGLVHPKRGEDAVRVELDVTRSLFRSMSNFELDATEQVHLNTEQDRIRIILVLQNAEEFPLGVYLFGDATRLRRGWGLDLSASLVDERYILNQAVGRNVGFSPGRNVIDSAVSIAQEVCACPMSIVTSSLTLTQPLGWRLSDTRSKIMEDLCQIAGYLPPYFDNAGTLTLRPVPIPPYSSNIPAYDVDTRIIKDSIVESDDLLQAPNRYIAIDSGATDSPIYGSYDISGSAPNSVANRGFPVVETISVQGLASNQTAVAAAQAAANHDPNQFFQVEFDSTLDPRHDQFEIVAFMGNQYREIGWSFEARAGAPMHHKLRRVFQ